MSTIYRLIVRCEKDYASRNICEGLVRQGGWEDFGSDDLCTYLRRGDDLLMNLPAKHLYSDDLDKRAMGMGFRPDVAIFPSVHSSESGMPALTVHPIGNYNDADYGGRERELVRAAPALMTSMLRTISSKCSVPGFNVCFEVTHHGPWLETPSLFLEIGSDITSWERPELGELQAEVIRDTEAEDYPVLIGVGGGHYAPRFTEVALGFKANFGHMIPNYQMDNRSDEDIARMLSSAAKASGTDMAYLHRKSMKGPQAQRIKALGESVGLQWVRSEDLEPLTGNR